MHRKYYELSYNIDIKEVGYQPQSNNLTIPFTRDMLAQYEALTSYPEDGFSDIPYLDKILLNEGSILTDYIDTTYLSHPIGILISEKFYKIAKQLVLFDTKTYEAKVKTSEEDVYPYYYIWIKDSSNKIIFPECIYKAKRFFEDAEPEVLEVPISKANDIFDYIQEHGLTPKANKIVLSSPLDIVRIPFDTGIYISERLKQIITYNKFTGMEIEPVKIDFYIKGEN